MEPEQWGPFQRDMGSPDEWAFLTRRNTERNTSSPIKWFHHTQQMTPMWGRRYAGLTEVLESATEEDDGLCTGNMAHEVLHVKTFDGKWPKPEEEGAGEFLRLCSCLARRFMKVDSSRHRYPTYLNLMFGFTSPSRYALRTSNCCLLVHTLPVVPRLSTLTICPNAICILRCFSLVRRVPLQLVAHCIHHRPLYPCRHCP